MDRVLVHDEFKTDGGKVNDIALLRLGDIPFSSWSWFLNYYVLQ